MNTRTLTYHSKFDISFANSYDSYVFRSVFLNSYILFLFLGHLKDKIVHYLMFRHVGAHAPPPHDVLCNVVGHHSSPIAIVYRTILDYLRIMSSRPTPVCLCCHNHCPTVPPWSHGPISRTHHPWPWERCSEGGSNHSPLQVRLDASSVIEENLM